MRQITTREAGAVSGANCGDLTMTIGITGASITGSISNWAGCFNTLGDWVTDMYYGATSTYDAGIPYGEPHVG
jgi:hypothetical protein